MIKLLCESVCVSVSGHHNHFTALFPGPLGWAGARREFWILWCKGRSTEADIPTIRLGAIPSGLTNAHLHHLRIFYRPDALPAAQPTVSKHCRQLAHSDYGEDARVLLNGVTCTVSIPFVCIRTVTLKWYDFWPRYFGMLVHQGQGRWSKLH